MSELLSQQQLHEMNVRMRGTNGHRKAEDVFSAAFAKQIEKNETLIFQIMCIQNALELGLVSTAIEHCKKALGR